MEEIAQNASRKQDLMLLNRAIVHDAPSSTKMRTGQAALTNALQPLATFRNISVCQKKNPSKAAHYLTLSPIFHTPQNHSWSFLILPVWAAAGGMSQALGNMTVMRAAWGLVSSLAEHNSKWNMSKSLSAGHYF